MSMATMASEFCRSILAAVTNWLPGPRILSTCVIFGYRTFLNNACQSWGHPICQVSHFCKLLAFGQVCVPQAMAATACAPPALSTCVTPALRAQYSTSGVMDPSGRGGVAMTIVEQPAMPAGTHSISAEEGSTAVPPGTYTPTAPVREQLVGD